jgi:hypothetical protein
VSTGPAKRKRPAGRASDWPASFPERGCRARSGPASSRSTWRRNLRADQLERLLEAPLGAGGLDDDVELSLRRLSRRLDVAPDGQLLRVLAENLQAAAASQDLGDEEGELAIPQERDPVVWMKRHLLQELERRRGGLDEDGDLVIERVGQRVQVAARQGQIFGEGPRSDRGCRARSGWDNGDPGPRRTTSRRRKRR